MARNNFYPIATVQFPSDLTSTTFLNEARQLKNYLGSNGLEGKVTLSADQGNNCVEVCGDPTIIATQVKLNQFQRNVLHVLGEYAARVGAKKGEKISCDVEEPDGKVMVRYETSNGVGGNSALLEAQVMDLGAQVTTANNEVDTYKGLLEAAQSETDAANEEKARVQGKLEEMAGLLENAQRHALQSKGSLETLASNTELYQSGQQAIVSEIYKGIADYIDSVSLRFEGDIVAARETLKGKAFYESETGKAALAILPEPARKLAEEEWAKAEETVRLYDESRAARGTELPIAIMIGEEGLSVAVPSYQKGKGDLSVAIEDAFEKFRDVLFKVDGSKCSEHCWNTPYLSIRTGHHASANTVKQKVVDFMQEKLAEYGMNVSAFIVYGSPESLLIKGYAPPESPTLQPVREEHAASPKKTDEDPVTFSGWLDVQMKNRDFETDAELAEVAGLSPGTIGRMRKGEGTLYAPTRTKLANALEIPIDEVSAALAKFQRSPAEPAEMQ